MTKIVIYGASGFGREVAWLIENINARSRRYEILGFIDDNPGKCGQQVNQFPVLGGQSWFGGCKEEVEFACAIGSSKIRRKLLEELGKYKHVRPATLIDPSACVAPSAQIGAGCIVGCACRIMVNAVIGNGVVMNTGASVGHDGVIGDYATLLTNVMVSGGGKVGANSEIGSGAFILQYKSVGADCVVAPLASVLSDLAEPGMYAGNPARRMR
jgi:sugar O-acyltransferase (sialic acid O-acetyltransferase NeuD family)